MNDKVELFTRYPLSSLIIYNGCTIMHFLLGGTGIMQGYNFSSWAGYVFGILYLVFSFSEMYLLMPLKVCPNCVYFKMKDSLCISGMNQVSRCIAKQGNSKNFGNRSKGLLCNNNLYIAALVIPIIAIIPVLFINYSLILLIVFILLIILILFRFFIVFPKIACIHCRAKFNCPQAEAMGLREL